MAVRKRDRLLESEARDSVSKLPAWAKNLTFDGIVTDERGHGAGQWSFELNPRVLAFGGLIWEAMRPLPLWQRLVLFPQAWLVFLRKEVGKDGITDTN